MFQPKVEESGEGTSKAIELEALLWTILCSMGGDAAFAICAERNVCVYIYMYTNFGVSDEL